MKILVLAVCGMATVLAAGPALAHHSGAMYDNGKTVTLDGTVKQFQWTNPHSWVVMDTANAKGGLDEWSFELGPLVGLQRAGWKPRTLQPGDKIQVTAHPMRDGTYGGLLMKLTLADGQVLTQGGGGPPGGGQRGGPPADPNARD